MGTAQRGATARAFWVREVAARKARAAVHAQEADSLVMMRQTAEAYQEAASSESRRIEPRRLRDIDFLPPPASQRRVATGEGVRTAGEAQGGGKPAQRQSRESFLRALRQEIADAQNRGPVVQ